MMSDLVEVFKVVGAAGGLISAGFLLYDRLVRIRPQAFLTKGEYPGQLMITVRNVSNESIIVDEFAVAPNIFGIAHGDSTRAIAAVVVARRGHEEKQSSRKVFIVLKPLEELQLNLITFDKFEQASGDQAVVMRIAWRTTRFRMPFKRNIKIRTSAADIRAMKEKGSDIDD
jgi:hypothetical protein